MDKFRALIIDDEEPGRRNLSIILNKYCPEIEIIGEADNAITAKEKILNLTPDVIFLDVQMPEMDGFDLLEMLPKKDFAIIIVTAHAEYGIKAVKAGAIDYILKPIVVKELQQAINKVTDYYTSRKPETIIDAQRPDRLTLTHSGGFAVIEISNVVRLEADNNYTKVHTIDRKAYYVSKPLKVFEDNLKGTNFFRLHRSYIINLNYVKEYIREDGGIVIMADDARIQIPKTRHVEFLEALRKLSISL